MKLEITTEKVLEAAKNCTQAKEVLKTLFPEAFESEDEYFDFSPLGENHDLDIKFDGHLQIAVSGCPNGMEYLRNKALYLSSLCEWELIDSAFGAGSKILYGKKRK